MSSKLEKGKGTTLFLEQLVHTRVPGSGVDFFDKFAVIVVRGLGHGKLTDLLMLWGRGGGAGAETLVDTGRVSSDEVDLKLSKTRFTQNQERITGQLVSMP